MFDLYDILMKDYDGRLQITMSVPAKLTGIAIDDYILRHANVKYGESGKYLWTNIIHKHKIA